MAREDHRCRCGWAIDESVSGMPARVVPRFDGIADPIDSRGDSPIPGRALADPALLPAGTPDARFDHEQRLPLVRAKHESIRPVERPGRAEDCHEHDPSWQQAAVAGGARRAVTLTAKPSLPMLRERV